MQLSLHRGQQLQAGGTSTRSPTAHLSPIKVQADLHLNQGGGQQSGMPPKTKPHHRDPQKLITGFKGLPQPIDRGFDIRKDPLGARGLLMASTFASGIGVIAQLQLWGRARKQRHR